MWLAVRRVEKDGLLPKPYPKEFRDEVAQDFGGQQWPFGWVRGEGFRTETVREIPEEESFGAYAERYIGLLTGNQDDTKGKHQRQVEQKMLPWFQHLSVREGESGIGREDVARWVNDLAAGRRGPYAARGQRYRGSGRRPSGTSTGCSPPEYGVRRKPRPVAEIVREGGGPGRLWTALHGIATAGRHLASAIPHCISRLADRLASDDPEFTPKKTSPKNLRWRPLSAAHRDHLTKPHAPTERTSETAAAHLATPPEPPARRSPERTSTPFSAIAPSPRPRHPAWQTASTPSSRSTAPTTGPRRRTQVHYPALHPAPTSDPPPKPDARPSETTPGLGMPNTCARPCPPPIRTFLMANVGDDSENPATLHYIKHCAAPFARAHDLELVLLRKVMKRTGEIRTLYQDLTRPAPVPCASRYGCPTAPPEPARARSSSRSR